MRILKVLLYLVGTWFFVVLSLEFLLRFTFLDPDYYWDRRFLFVSPNAYQNRGDRFWTYRPHMNIREVAVYGMPALFTAKPKMVVEYDCFMKSNNLGLLQNDDIEAGAAVTVIVGDSFTAGQGGCPWFERLQARRKTDRLLNAGLLGTGFGHWMRMTQYLQQQGIIAKRLLIIAISDDLRRRAWIWKQYQLDCLDHRACPAEDPRGLWLPVEINESHSSLIQRSAVRLSVRLGHPSWRDSSEVYLRNSLYLLKFITRAFENIREASERSGASEPTFPDVEEALERFRSLGIPMQVLLVTQKEEIKPFGNRRELEAAIAVLNKHEIAHSQCDLSKGDFMPYDGHPNRSGYDKLVLCVDTALNALGQRL